LIIASYITYIFKVFGLIDNSDIGYSTSDANAEATLGPVLDAFSSYRSQVREAVKQKDINKVLEISDFVRDDALPPLGIRFSDLPDGTSLWKLDDKDVLMKEVAQKREVELKKKEEKEKRIKEEKEKLEKKQAQGKIVPEQMFLSETDKYSAFDEKGIPTLDKEGKPLSKNQLKNLQKAYEKQQKLHEDYKKEMSSKTE